MVGWNSKRNLVLSRIFMTQKKKHKAFESLKDWGLIRFLICLVLSTLWVSDCCFTPIQQFSAISWREQANFQWDGDVSQLSNSKIPNLLSVSLYVEKTNRKWIPSSTTILQYLQKTTLVSMHCILLSTITYILPMILKWKTKNTTLSEQF
jgi:hypothetical protein